MILTDTGPLVALFNRTDAAHGDCVDTLKDIDEPIATTLPVLTEAPPAGTGWGRRRRPDGFHRRRGPEGDLF